MQGNRRLTSFLLAVFFVIGLSLVLYPLVSDYWNSVHQSQAVAGYAEDVASLNEEEYARLLEEAHAYNRDLLDRPNSYELPDEMKPRYEEALKFGRTAVMGYVEIPSIDVVLPIYHGTNERELQVAIGHLEWTSLPVGGESTHAVVSGHRGLPSARLFSDLDQLVVEDLFVVRVLDETLTYEVDQIKVVDPEQLSDLVIEEGKDLCTLVTCTPYGINTHRLLVRGHRVPNRPEANTVRLTSEATQIEPLIVAPILAIPILVTLVCLVAFGDSSKKKKVSVFDYMQEVQRQ